MSILPYTPATTQITVVTVGLVEHLLQPLRVAAAISHLRGYQTGQQPCLVNRHLFHAFQVAGADGAQKSIGEEIEGRARNQQIKDIILLSRKGEQLPADLDAPLGRVHLKQGRRWRPRQRAVVRLGPPQHRPDPGSQFPG